MSDPNTNAAPADTTVAAPQKRRGRPVDPNSSLAKARALFNGLAADERGRASVVEKLQGIGLTKDTAAAYFSLLNRGK